MSEVARVPISSLRSMWKQSSARFQFLIGSHTAPAVIEREVSGFRSLLADTKVGIPARQSAFCRVLPCDLSAAVAPAAFWISLFSALAVEQRRGSLMLVANELRPRPLPVSTMFGARKPPDTVARSSRLSVALMRRPSFGE